MTEELKNVNIPTFSKYFSFKETLIISVLFQLSYVF